MGEEATLPPGIDWYLKAMESPAVSTWTTLHSTCPARGCGTWQCLTLFWS